MYVGIKKRAISDLLTLMRYYKFY